MKTEDGGFDFLALGEAVVDLISSEAVASLGAATHFERFTGGQVTNLAMNMARLGNRVALAACVGDDSFGQLLRERVAAANVATGCLQVSAEAPTTLIPVTRTPRGTPDFLVYRGADAHLQATELLLAAAAQSRMVHTSAFALSRDPARSTVLAAMRAARASGQQVSLDPNYHPRIWPDVADFAAVLAEAYREVSVTKPSLDDCERLFGAGRPVAAYAERFLAWGAGLVAISMGAEGVYLATAAGERVQIAPQAVQALDVTGAGDAFWSGMLTALLDDHSPLDAVRAGQVVAQIKIQRVGPLSGSLDRAAIYAQMAAVDYRVLGLAGGG